MPDSAATAAVPPPEGALVRLCAVAREFDEGRVQALRGIDLEIASDETVAIVGPSGCGKSTLLQILGGIDRPSSGEVFFGGRRLSEVSDLSAYRAREIGFIFQAFHLIPTLTAVENVQIPMLECPGDRASRRRRAEELLESVGLKARVGHRPSQMSGGERQRVAVARSLANRPRLLLADEPTGNLDSASSQRIMDLLLDVHRQHRTAMVIVTHDPTVAARAARQVRMLDGRIVADERTKGGGA